MADPRTGVRRRELTIHASAAALGAAIAVVAFPDPAVGTLARAAALPLALSLVVHGLLGALALGRAEWRRATPPPSAYLRVVLRFLLGFVLGAVAVG